MAVLCHHVTPAWCSPCPLPPSPPAAQLPFCPCPTSSWGRQVTPRLGWVDLGMQLCDAGTQIAPPSAGVGLKPHSSMAGGGLVPCGLSETDGVGCTSTGAGPQPLLQVPSQIRGCSLAGGQWQACSGSVTVAGWVTVAGLTQQPIPRDFPGQDRGPCVAMTHSRGRGQPHPPAAGLSPLCGGSLVTWLPFAHLPS